MTYEDTPIGGLSVVDAADDPWLEIANELQEFQRRHAEIAATVTLPAARHIGELLDNLQQQYDNNADFLAEAEARVGLHKSQIYAYLGVHRGWEKIQAGIAAGHEIASIKEAGRFLSGASQAPKALKSAAVDGDHQQAPSPNTVEESSNTTVDMSSNTVESELQAPAAVVSTVVDVDATAAAQGPTTPALAALVAVPAACSQLMSEVPAGRNDLVEALQKLNTDAESLARRIRSAMAREVVSVPVAVEQLQVPEPAPGADAADIASGGAPEGAADSAGGKAKKAGSNRGVIANRFPKTPKGAQALLAELDRHKGDKDAFVAELGCTVRALDQNLVKYRAILAEAQP